jgi:hypothetical protein
MVFNMSNKYVFNTNLNFEIMRKIISTLFVSLMLLITANATVIFDPATYTGTLPAGASVVEIDGVKYLKVSPDSWNTSIEIPAVAIPANENKAKVMTKAKQGTGPQPLDKMKTFIKVYKDGTTTKEEFALGYNVSSGTINKVIADAKAFTADRIQFAFQETVTWGATTGDTLWVGKIETYEVDPLVIFDPATFEGTLPAGHEIVELSGKKYLKVTTASWGTGINIDAFATGTNNKMSAEMKVEAGTSGKALTALVAKLEAIGSDGSKPTLNKEGGDMTTITADIKPSVNITSFKVFVQEKAGAWPAVDGVIVYVGKITASFVQPTIRPADVTYEVPALPLNVDIVIDGIVSNDEFWSDAPEAKIDQLAKTWHGATGENTGGIMKMAWDPDYLYILVDAIDDDPTPNETPAAPWENDGAELFFDLLNNRYNDIKRKSNEGQHQIRFGLGRTTADTAAIMFPDVADEPKVVWALKESTKGWVLEVMLPWVNMSKGIVAYDLIPQFIADSIVPGKKIGFEVSVIDAAEKDKRLSIMNWSNRQKDDVANNWPAYWGELILKGASSIDNGVSQNTIKIYPNPAKGMVYINSNNLSSFKVLDMAGVTVSQGLFNGSNSIDIAGLNQGMYIIQVYDNKNTQFVQRLVIQ